MNIILYNNYFMPRQPTHDIHHIYIYTKKMKIIFKYFRTDVKTFKNINTK